jgi:hypothetical protein
VSLGPYREGQVSVFNRVEKRGAQFRNNRNESGWETLVQRRLIARICVLFKAQTGRLAWKAIGDRIRKQCYMSRDDRNRKIRTRKQITDVGKCSFANRTVRSCHQLPAGLQASFPCKINTFRKMVRNGVKSK